MSTYLKKGITNRIEWCDIFKGLIILLVVIGHATGEYHRYIYQFHMAAFFLYQAIQQILENILP